MKIPLDASNRIQVLVIMTPAQLQQIRTIEQSMGVTSTTWGFRYALVMWLITSKGMDKSEMLGALQTYSREDGLEVIPRSNVRIPFTIRPVTENVRDRYRNIKRMKHE